MVLLNFKSGHRKTHSKVVFPISGHSVRLLSKKKANGRKIGGASLDLPKVRKNELVEIIAISTGCLNQCTYCKTKHARGELGSYPPGKIITSVCLFSLISITRNDERPRIHRYRQPRVLGRFLGCLSNK